MLRRRHFITPQPLASFLPTPPPACPRLLSPRVGRGLWRPRRVLDGWPRPWVQRGGSGKCGGVGWASGPEAGRGLRPRAL